jgi:hypothetical protein
MIIIVTVATIARAQSQDLPRSLFVHEGGAQ